MKYFTVPLVRYITVEVPDTADERLIREALHGYEGSEVVDPEADVDAYLVWEASPSLLQAEPAALAIDSDGTISKIDPFIAPPDHALFQQGGTRWATTGDGAWREDVAPKMARGTWVSSADLALEPLPIDALGSHVVVGREPVRWERRSIAAQWLDCGQGYRVIVSDALLATVPEGAELRCAGELDPVGAYRDGGLVAMLMPMRQDWAKCPGDEGGRR